MRISYWSSEVCSSDLTGVDRTLSRPFRHGLGSSPQPYSRKTEEAWHRTCRYTVGPATRGHSRMVVAFRGRASTLRPPDGGEIGRASCRARVCQYVTISVVAVSLNTKRNIK